MAQPLPLRVEGNQIKDSSGRRRRLLGVSDFGQFKRWLATPGHPEILVEPIIAERTTLAADAGWDVDKDNLVARVFGHAGPWNAFGIVDPWSYPMSAVRDFTQFYGEHDWYVDWTFGDHQVCFPSPDPRMGEVHGPRGINQHKNEFFAAIADLPNVIANTCNEPFKNGVDTSVVKLPPWAPPVQYSGLYYDNWLPVNATDLACINYHPDRGDDYLNGGYVPKFVGKLGETAVYLYRLGKPIIYDEPIGADEVTIPGRRTNNPEYWFEMGRSLGLVDAFYFHSTPGLASDGFGPIVKQCWQACCRGARGAV